MKLLFVTPAYRPSFHEGGKGGGEISNQILLEDFSRRGHTVVVVSMGSVVRKRIYRDGKLIVIEPFANTTAKELRHFISILFFQRSISKLINSIRPDVVLATTSTIKVAARSSKRFGLPVGAVVRAMENVPGYGWKWSIFSPRSLMKYLLHKVTIGWPGGRELELVDFFVANSEFLQRKYQDAFPEKKSVVVYPALAIKPTTAPFPSNIRRVMMVGTTEAKGFDIYAELACQMPELEFHAIGDRSLGRGETKMHGRVEVHGWYSDPIPFIDGVDLVIVPSRWEEPFGRISLEALYRHKFVLVSGQGGLPETVSGIENLIVRSSLAEDWNNRISDVIVEIKNYTSETSNALELAKRFGKNRQAVNFEEFLKSNFVFLNKS